ncbi:MAG: hypothetical protein LKK19_06115 [Bacteroidales bacterium]|jgi:hypothetical protein|nr:hypothetical protein [Bacteroidales bacterium]MCI2145611.1 hypothetical protein [Bacteroidales bacterium]
MRRINDSSPYVEGDLFGPVGEAESGDARARAKATPRKVARHRKREAMEMIDENAGFKEPYVAPVIEIFDVPADAQF